MNPFRNKTPQRRANRTPCEHYRSYRETLREDFNKRCGYCDDSDHFSIRSFAIDHFVPQNPKGFTHNIEPNYYYNLVWACSYCNLAKSNEWFTNVAEIHNDGNKGFLEPTNEEYTNLFKRDKDGKIICNDINPSLAEDIIDKVKLWYPVHNITWRLEKLDFLEKLVSYKILQLENSPFRDELTATQNEIRGILIDLYRCLFAENE
jgi:HNH endonuclease